MARYLERRAKRPGYYFTTWDTDLQAFTPQKGVRCGPYSKWGVRKAIRALRDMGYPCYRSFNGNNGSDPSVLAQLLDSGDRIGGPV